MVHLPELGMRAHDIKAHTPKELSEKCKAMQIPYIQLALRKSFSDIQWTNHSFCPGLAEKIKSELNGIRISVLGSYINLLAEGDELDNALATFRQNMLFAKYLGAGVVGTETGTAMCEYSEANYQKVYRAVRTLADDAEKLGVMIAIEGVCVHTIRTPQLMRRLLDDVNSPNVMTIFDPVNYLTADNYIDQDTMLREMFSLLADKMVAIHLKDFKMIDGVMHIVPCGTGLLNIPLLYELIRAEKPGLDVLLEESNEERFETERRTIAEILS